MIIILLAKLIIHTVYANSRKEDCWITKQQKPLKIQTKWKQPGALKKHTQHSWGLLLLIAAKSANIDMLNRLASLITGRVNMATAADPWGYPVGRLIACVFHILTLASVELAPVDTPNSLHSLDQEHSARFPHVEKGSRYHHSAWVTVLWLCCVQKWKLWQLEIWLCFTQRQLVSYTFRLPLYRINGFKYLNASWSWQGLSVCRCVSRAWI